MKKRTLLLYIPIAVLLMSVASCGKKNSQTADAKPTDTAKVVLVAQPRLDTVEVRESFSANVEAFVKNNIAPQTPNRINKILVEVGQNVSRGQLLATLDDASLKQQELRLANSKSNWTRIDELYKVGGISRAQWESAKIAYDADQTAYNNLKINTRLVSPISGVVTARNYDNGDMFTGQMPILVVEQIAPLKVYINVNEKYFTYIKKGMPVQLTFDVFPNETFEGKVALISPTIDPTSRTFQVEVHLTNADKRVRPGMYAHVSVHMQNQVAYMIPDMAVLSLPGTNEYYVYVVKDGKADRRSVQVGDIVGSEYEILKGLTADDKVITSGLSSMKEGEAVTVKQ